VPDVHEALEAAKSCDPSRIVRKDAARALEKLADECEGECSVCGTMEMEGGDGSIVIESGPPSETRFQPLPLPIGPAEVVSPSFEPPVGLEELPPPAVESPLPPLAPLPSEIPPLPATSAPFESVNGSDRGANRTSKEVGDGHVVKTVRVARADGDSTAERDRSEPSDRKVDRKAGEKKSSEPRPRTGLLGRFSRRLLDR
jgi:hypothetical protein